MKVNEIGVMLRASRKANGLVLREAAAAVEMDMALLSNVERGQRMPTEKQVRSLAKLYHKPVEPFLAARAYSKIKQKYGQTEYYADCLQMLSEDASEYNKPKR